MNSTDFSDCEYINTYLRFVTYNDFCDNCGLIKSLYSALDKNGKRFYKWYVYANIHFNELRKDAIWEFLNSEDEIYYEKLIYRKTHSN